MAQRIGQEDAKIINIGRQRRNSLKEDWRGEMIIAGTIEQFCTDIRNIQPGNTYSIVYERTETLSGEPIIKIHEITNERDDDTNPK